MRNRAVILARDGTVIEERHYLSDPEQVALIPRIAPALRALRQMGLRLLVVTNQSAVGRGVFDQHRLEQIHERLRQLLAAEGVSVDGIYYCPHAPEDACACRKPKPGLMERVARDHQVDPQACFVLGDKQCDLDFGRQLGATTFLVRTGYGAALAAQRVEGADYIVDDVFEAVPIIGRLLRRAPSLPEAVRDGREG